MDFLVQINAIGWDCPLYFLRGHRMELPNYDVFMSLMIVTTSAKSEDPDEMQHYAAFHLGLHCLQKYPFRGFPIYIGILCVCVCVCVRACVRACVCVCVCLTSHQ